MLLYCASGMTLTSGPGKCALDELLPGNRKHPAVDVTTLRGCHSLCGPSGCEHHVLVTAVEVGQPRKK